MGIHFIHERGKAQPAAPHHHPRLAQHRLSRCRRSSPADRPASHGGDPADAFDVVAPSMPGYGFSDHTAKRGINIARIADLWAQLMTDGRLSAAPRAATGARG